MNTIAHSAVAVLAFAAGSAASAEAPPATFMDMPLLLAEDFESGKADRWEPTDAKAWKVDVQDGNHVYNLHNRKSDFKPPVRSPFNRSLLKDVVVGDFVLEARVRSTIKDYGHRDLCFFFGYQDDSHLYYVHLGKKTDDHANQIFIVDDAPRTKISTKTTAGTPWDDKWHRIRVVRKVEAGTIAIYFDDMENPVMTATNKAFTWGRVGVGSFDDTGLFDDIRLWGVKGEKPAGK